MQDNLFERLDRIEEALREQNEKIRQESEKQDLREDAARRRYEIDLFLQQAKKYAVFLPGRDIYRKQKRTALLLAVLLILTDVLATVAMGLSVGVYSFLSLAENFWCLMMISILFQLLRLRPMSRCDRHALVLFESSFYIKPGFYVRTVRTAVHYRVAQIFALMGAGLNAVASLIMLFTEENPLKHLPGLLLECAVLVLIVHAFRKARAFVAGYRAVLFTLPGSSDGMQTDLLYCLSDKLFYTPEAFQNRYPEVCLDFYHKK